MLALCFAAALLSAPAGLAATPSKIEFAVCPNITMTLYPGLTVQPAGCAITTTCEPPMSNSNLGTFLITQNPLGAIIHASAPNDCTTNPPKLGPGADGAAVKLNVVQTGFCLTSSAISAQLGPQAFVIVPIGSLPLGTYTVTATLPEQTVGSFSW